MSGDLSSIYATSIFQILEEMGYPLARAISTCSITKDDLSNIKYRVPVENMTAVFDDAAEVLDIADIGLQTGFRFRVYTFAETGSILAHTSTIAEAVQINTTYEPLVETVGVSSLAREAKGDFMLWTVHDKTIDPDINRHFTELVLAGYAMTTHWLAWSLNGGLLSAGFQHSPPPDTASYERILQCPVSFNCDRNFIQFSPDLIDKPLPSANPDKLMSLRRRLDVVLAKMQQTSQIRETLADEITRALKEGPVTEIIIAKSMGLSTRNLSRLLKADGLTFRAVLNETRKEMALSYMRNGRSLSDVALMLGYSDQPAFTRAFKRWFGVPPSKYRSDSIQF